MPDLIESLAHLTGQRDRDVLDRSLLALMRDLLHPQALAIHHAVSDGVDRRWLTGPRLDARGTGEARAVACGDHGALPRLDEHPERCACLDGAIQVAVPGPPHARLVPLANDREVVGVLEINTAVPMDGEQLRVVDGLQRFYRHLRGLLDENERDALTGLLNRKSFDMAFLHASMGAEASEHAGPERRRAPAEASHYLGVVDVDHFKAVNDTHGHLIGDEVLLLLAGLMRSSFRHDDRLYRFGGEEFVVFTNRIPIPHAATAFERLRRNVEGFAFPQIGRLTVSIGFTPIRPNDTPGSAMQRADEALYFAKTHGRNAVCSHADLVASGQAGQAAPAGAIELF